MNKELSICICVYNKYNFTKTCLKDLSKLPNTHEIIIVDNNSSDETQKQLEGSKEITYYRSHINGGFAYGSNMAYNLSTGNNVLFLNNDIKVRDNFDGWTKPIIDNCKDYLVGPTMGQLDSKFNFIKEANEELGGLSYMSGWCLGSSKENFEKLKVKSNEILAVDSIVPQIFSQKYGIAYHEDTDLSFRARQMNMKFKVVSIPVVHFGKQTSSQLNTALLYKASKEIFIKTWKNQI